MLPIGWDKLLPPVRFRSVGIYALYLVENLIGAVRLVLVLVVCVFPTCYASSVEVITVLSPRVDFPAFRRMVDSLSALSSAFSFEKGKDLAVLPVSFLDFCGHFALFCIRFLLFGKVGKYFSPHQTYSTTETLFLLYFSQPRIRALKFTYKLHIRGYLQA